MTIIKPSLYEKNKKFIFLVIGVVLVFGILYIYKYNELANLRFQEKNLKKEIEALSKEHNELKSRLFVITDPRNFDEIAKKYNLVLENKPEYFVLNKWLHEQTF